MITITCSSLIIAGLLLSLAGLGCLGSWPNFAHIFIISGISCGLIVLFAKLLKLLL